MLKRIIKELEWLISDKIDVKTKVLLEIKKRFHNDKSVNHLEDKTILKVHAPNNRTSK